ncbi:MAG: hypothetical protein ACLFR1_09005 [Spirochaetia bacterium]
MESIINITKIAETCICCGKHLSEIGGQRVVGTPSKSVYLFDYKKEPDKLGAVILTVKNPGIGNKQMKAEVPLPGSTLSLT